jgi:hypothetical protein
VISRRPLDPVTQAGDDDLLQQRLALAVARSGESATTRFRRRRSSGLLFQIRRRIRRAAPLATFVPPGPPTA